ncbi:cell wall anchor protein [Streptococcus agalactiae]|uniref:cell wall anchor protein n=1 Tax=Streptococcus agalactiae TaxID=1311 RepID=UPI001F4D738B|nr:cell wall anchor protein [Streptococcus agalactiae]MCH9591281.1 cell wall anchor protein [Streptococcus agalactiae]
MTKKQLLVLSCVSVLSLAGTTALAEDVTPVDATVPSSEVVTPRTPVDQGTPTTPTEPSTPVDPGTPTDTTEPSTPVDPGHPGSNPGTETPTPGSNTNQPITPTEPIVTPTPEKTVVTDTGAEIVSTQDSKVIIKNSDGSYATKTAEEIGGTTNPDGTVTVKEKDGKKKTLPNTGTSPMDKVFSFLGAFVAIVGMVFIKPTNPGRTY